MVRLCPTAQCTIYSVSLENRRLSERCGLAGFELASVLSSCHRVTVQPFPSYCHHLFFLAANLICFLFSSLRFSLLSLSSSFYFSSFPDLTPC